MRAPRILALSDDRSLRDLLDDMLLGRAVVTWAYGPNETEGVDVDAVVIDEPHARDTLRQLLVHPRLHDVPVVVIGEPDAVTSRHVSWVKGAGPKAIAELRASIERIVSMAHHPSRGARRERSPAA